MQKEINLLPHRNLTFLQQERTVTIARVVAVFSIVIVLSSLIGVLFLGKNYSLENVATRQNNIQSRLNLLSGKTNNDLQLVDRATRIEKIINSRPSMLTQIDIIQKQIPTGVTIDTLSITKDGVSLSVSSKSLANIKSLLSSFTSLVSDKKIFKTLTIQNVIVDQQTGLYSVGLQGTLL